jgi:threonine dehydrogenase-like Zn-dependent dehydrogenase
VPTVQAATLVAHHRLEVREYPYPERLEPGAVLLRMLASGICGTDKHTYRGETEQYAGTEFARSTPFPIIQGHENVGVVEAVGPGGATAWDGLPLAPGDRVVPAPNRACGSCRFCRRGFPYYFCRALENYGNSLSSRDAPHLFGGWAEYLYLRPGTAVFRVPESLPTDIAVLTEIFAVTHSLERAAALPRPAGWRPGDRVAVIGVGALGQAHAIKAALMGAGTVVAVDSSARRLDLARRLAGAHAVPAGPEAVAAVMELTAGEGADVVVDATGFPRSFGQAVEMVRDGGAIVEVGAFVDMGGEPFNPAVLCGRNLAMLGVGGEDLLAYEGTLALLDRHRPAIPFADMVSHRFGVAEAPQAMAVALDADASAKVLITPNGPV